LTSSDEDRRVVELCFRSGAACGRRRNVGVLSPRRTAIGSGELWRFDVCRSTYSDCIPAARSCSDRDASDDDLDTAAQDARAKLAGRSADAVTKTPYTQIFPDGIGFYTAAPLDEEDARYSLFSQRLAAHLPANDKVRTSTIPVIETGLSDFAKATKELTAARNAASIADGHLATAEDAWEKQMEKTYGALVVEVGRAAADRFFPKTKTKSKKGGPATPPSDG
jgi:hypothetical protein